MLGSQALGGAECVTSWEDVWEARLTRLGGFNVPWAGQGQGREQHGPAVVAWVQAVALPGSATLGLRLAAEPWHWGLASEPKQFREVQRQTEGGYGVPHLQGQTEAPLATEWTGPARPAGS